MRIFELSLEDGLSQGTVNAILKDNYGFMWFGTKDGLNRYDGYDFEVFRHSDLEANSISNSYIMCMVEGSGGKLWIGTSGGGINIFDYQTEAFTNILLDATSEFSGSNTVQTLLEDRDNYIWAGTKGRGLFKIDQKSLKISEHYLHSPDDINSIGSNDIKDIFLDSSGRFWIGTFGGGLNLFHPEDKTFSRYIPAPAARETIESCMITSIAEAPVNKIWVGTNGSGLRLFDPVKLDFEYFKLDSSVVNPIVSEIIPAVLSVGEILWFSINPYGLHHYNGTDFTRIIPASMRDDNHAFWGVNTLYIDDVGNLWVGSNGYGIVLLSPISEKFGLFKRERNNTNSLRMSSVRAIQEVRDGKLWIGGYGALDRIDRKTGLVEHSEFIHELKPHKFYSDKVLNGNVYCIYPDLVQTDNIVWLGTEGGGISKYSISDKTYLHYPFSDKEADPNFLQGGEVFDMAQETNGRLWIGTNKGLNCLDKATDKFTAYLYDPNDDRSIPQGRVMSVYVDLEGILWVGTSLEGMAQMNPESGKFTRFKHKPGDDNSLAENCVLCFYEDSKYRFWIGTRGGGLNEFDKLTGNCTRYTTADGLPNDVVYGILEDEAGNLWLSTNLGLCKFNPEENTFENYDIKDGLQSNEFNTGAYYKSPSGEMFFGGISGVSYFYPDNIVNNPHIPPVKITALRILNSEITHNTLVNDKRMLTCPMYLTSDLVLSYKDYVFSFEFAALNYIVPENNEYAYILHGFDNGWNYCKNRRFASYTNLPAGNYTFQVKGSNNDGIWNEEGASLKIRITPPFWKTAWFRLLVVISVVAIVIVWHYTRMAQLETQRRKLERLVDERTRELRASNARLKAIFDNASIGIGVSDMEGNYVQVNDKWAKMFGYNEQKSLTKNFRDITAPADVDMTLLNIDMLKKGDVEIYRLEKRFIRKDFSMFWGDITVSAIRDSEGKIEAVIELIVDISERKKYEKERENLIKELQEALAEVRTLAGLLPICSNCKKIRDDQGYWQQVETYIGSKTNVEFSHGICPDCLVKLYPEYYKNK